MKTKIKEVITLRKINEEMNPFNQYKFTTNYLHESTHYVDLPAEIEIKIKREIKSIKEFLEVNDYCAHDVLAYLKNNYKSI